MERDEKMETWTASQDVYKRNMRQPMKKQINQSIQCQSTSANPNFSISFHQFSSISALYFLLLAKFCQFLNTVLFHSFIVKSNISLAIPTFYFQVLFKFLSIFQHSIIFTVNSNVYFNNYNIMFPSLIQVCQFSNTVLFH